MHRHRPLFDTRSRDLCSVISLAVGLMLPADSARAADGDVRIEFRFTPVPNAQVAIWLTRPDGTFVQDVFVTQATGTLGIGNRPGLWNFLSSWRFPYGPRPGVLPVWAHARGRQYPALVFHDDDPNDSESLGWHENASSPEPYFCRPLNADEHASIASDSMTCPSPTTFQSDKGRFGSATSVYPPRGDLISFERDHDHPDVEMFSTLNDLDAVTRATPAGNREESISIRIDATTAQAPLVAWLEINLEDDQNDAWSFDRDSDHHVDPRLSKFGVSYLGQPSVVFRLEFDPLADAFVGTGEHAGYGALDGTHGTLHPPDGSLSAADGSGVDRLRLAEQEGASYRFGARPYSNGATPSPDACAQVQLPSVTNLVLEPLAFDRVRVNFTVPDQPNMDVQTVRLFYRAGSLAILEDTVAGTYQQVASEADCGGPIGPGSSTWCDIAELWGNTPYQIAIRYEDACGNTSGLFGGEVITPRQEFATVKGACFVATAAWGAVWTDHVRSLRQFRDQYLKQAGFGWALMALYYAHAPALADAIAPHTEVRALARLLLTPLARLAAAATRAGPTPAQ